MTDIVITLAGSGNTILGTVDELPAQGEPGPQGHTGPRGPSWPYTTGLSVTRDDDTHLIASVAQTLSDGSERTLTVTRDEDGILTGLVSS